MGDECPFCNERSLTWEDLDNFQLHNGVTYITCTGIRVCTSCGGVVDENNFTADEGIYNSGQAAVSSYSQATAKERQQYNIRCGASSMFKGRRLGLDLTKRIAHYVDCRPSMTAEAVELFERLMKHPDFISRRVVAKLAMAACCVYIICRQHNWPVMLGDVCGLVGKSVHAVNSWNKRIMATFPDLASVRAPNLFELLSARCGKASISSEVQQTAIAIIKLCRDLWITEGRKQDNIVIAALFIAWQSEEPVYRLKTKLRTFCRDHQLSSGSSATSCLANMQQLLHRLADKIPWVTANSFSDTNIAFHVKDIINYRRTLIAEARSEILRIQSADDDDVAHTGSAISNSDVACQSSESIVANTDNSNGQSAVRVNTDVVISSDAGFSDCATNTSENESAVKNNGRTVKRKRADYYDSFWPPPGHKPYNSRLSATKVAKKKKTKEENKLPINHPDMDCPHLSTHDIPDEDMHLYIKSSAEQQLDVNLQNDAFLL